MRAKLVVLSVLLSVSAAASAAPLYGIMFRTGGQTSGLNPKLYDVDPATGTATNPRNVNVNDCVGIAVGPDGTMYGMTDQFGRINNQSGSGGKNLLFSINATTGLATGIGRIDPTGVLQMFEGDIAFDPITGELWGVSTLQTSAALMKINTATGLGTVISTILPPSGVTAFDVSALTFAANGDMWVLDTIYPTTPGPARLYRINPATGAILQQFNTTTNLGNCAGMAFNPADGQLLIADGDTGATANLYRFNFSTSQLELIGPTGASGGTNPVYTGLAGLTFGIPEPASLLLLGLVVIVARRR